MVLARRIGSTKAILPVVAVAVTVLGLIGGYEALFPEAPYPIPITDFGRDLLGARAAQLDINPYQTVGELAALVPDSEISADAAELWVAHSPLSIALARLWLAVTGPDSAEDIAEFVQGISLVLLLGGVWLFGSRTWSSWHGLLLASATAMTIGFRSDAFWIQGASLLVLGLVTFNFLERRGHRNVAMVLLGVMVAWRPWLTPVAVVLPGSKSGFKDGAQVALTATAATLLVLPWIGGWHSLSAWLFEALPANVDYYSVHGSNLSLTGQVFPTAVATVLYVAVVALLPSMRRRWPTESWHLLGAVVILTFTPLVWPQYWLALTGVLLWLAKARSLIWVVLLLLLMAWPFTEHSGITGRLTSYLAVALLIVTLFAKSIPGVNDQAPPLQKSPLETEG